MLQTETGIVTLSPTQLDLTEKIAAALSPIEELAKSISADYASVSLVIPFVKMLFKTLQKQHNDTGVRTMKNEMLHNLKQRFSDFGDKQHLYSHQHATPSPNQQTKHGTTVHFKKVRHLIQAPLQYKWLCMRC